MKLLIFLISASVSHCGIIREDHEVQHHDRATSYQNIHIEHFHPVPTYIKKEHKHLLEHPISLGKSSSKLEVHHGGKHDHGYAIADAENDAHGGFGEGHEESLQSFDGHENPYQVQDEGAGEYQYQGHVEQDLGEADLGHYQLPEGLGAHGSLEGHESE